MTLTFSHNQFYKRKKSHWPLGMAGTLGGKRTIKVHSLHPIHPNKTIPMAGAVSAHRAPGAGRSRGPQPRTPEPRADSPAAVPTQPL